MTPLPDTPDYLKTEDAHLFQRAYAYSAAAHTGQVRADGTEYITHPLAVAQILATWHMDAQTLVAALLHDVVEDTDISHADIAEHFGEAIASLVDGVTKLDQIHFESKAEAQAENFRKMLLAMSRDVRVILIKLADRCHNMRTLGAMAEDKRQRIAQETIDIYAPIANRLGLNQLYQELENTAFRNLHPTRYKVLEKALLEARIDQATVLEKIRTDIQDGLTQVGLSTEVTRREKHLASIHRKMQTKHLTFAEVYDIYGFRVITDTSLACYTALGVLHSLYKPIPGKFKDYIAIGKANGYQSLHTTVFGPFGAPIEVQIRSREMHRIAESGVASHWMYKSAEGELSRAQQQTHKWLQGLLDIQADSRDSSDFLEHIKVDLFPDAVYVFTPKGSIMSLPRGATVIDFAYAVHTTIGNHCQSARINGNLAPLSTPLSNGDRVEIITDAQALPNPAWAHFAYTGKARAQIRSALKHANQQDSEALGGLLLGQAFRAFSADPNELTDKQWKKYTRDTGRTRVETLIDIGLGKQLGVVVARQLLARVEGPSGRYIHTSGPLLIRGSEGIAVRMGHCCDPIPGDHIIGQIKKGQGLIIHTHECPQVKHYREAPDKWIDVEWAAELDRIFRVTIRVIALNQRGVLASVASVIAAEGSNIDDVHMVEDTGGAHTQIIFTVQVQNRAHLSRLMRAMRALPEVSRIHRLRNADHAHPAPHPSKEP
jgi:GTP diphosphokinase / guanosine-3',5'-bis(diphosphate) 3'-diphosphatase